MVPLKTTTTENEKIELDERIYSRDTPAVTAEPQPSNVLDITLLLAKSKRFIGRITLVCVIVGGVVSLLLRNTYTAQTRILPPQQNQSAISALLGQFGALGSLLGKDLGAKNSSDLYVSMLESRTVADALIARFDLQSLYALYGKKRIADTREKLKDFTEISVDKKSGVITVSVDDHEPWRAAALTNAYVEELYRLNQRLVVTEAGQRRVFFEKELKQAKNDLGDAEVALRKTQEQTGLIQIDAQSRAIIEGAARLRAQISAREVQLQSMRSYATEENSGVKRLEQEISTLKSQLEKAQRGQRGGEGDIQLPTGTIPSAALEYVRRFRDVKYYETLFEIMAKQFELAKIDEAKSAAMIQILDVAVSPDKKSKPYRLLIVAVSLFLGLFLSITWLLFRDFYERAKEEPVNQAKLQILRTYLHLKG